MKMKRCMGLLVLGLFFGAIPQSEAVNEQLIVTFTQVAASTDGTQFVTIIENQAGIEIDLFQAAIGESLVKEGTVVVRPPAGTYKYLKVFIKSVVFIGESVERDISNSFITAGIPLDPLCFAWNGQSFGECSNSLYMVPFTMPDDESQVSLNLNFICRPMMSLSIPLAMLSWGRRRRLRCGLPIPHYVPPKIWQRLRLR